MWGFKNVFCLLEFKSSPSAYSIQFWSDTRLNGYFFLCTGVRLPERPMSLLGKLHRQQRTAGGGATLNKEAGLWLVRGGQRGMNRARELWEWLNGTEWEGGTEWGKDRYTEIAADGLLHSQQHTYKGQTACVTVCVCVCAGSVAVCTSVWLWMSERIYVLWTRLQWGIILLRKKGYRQSEHVCSSHFGCFHRAGASSTKKATVASLSSMHVKGVSR